jgi:magnesium transporter
MTEYTDATALANELEKLSADNAVKRLSRENANIREQALALLTAEQRSAITARMLEEAIEPDENETAVENDNVYNVVSGGIAELMTPIVGALSEDTTVAGALDHLVHMNPDTTITYLYVVDPENTLLGVVAMRDLLLARPGQTLAEIMNPAPFAFRLEMSISAAVRQALKRRHRLYPVVDDHNKLVGLVYGWKLFERLATDLTAQSGSMVGVDKSERVSTPILAAFRMRHPWLQVNLLTAFMAAMVVGFFEDTIARIVALAVFLPVLAGQSGNTGCQALAITLRGITLGDLPEFPVYRLLRKEICLGAMNGFAVGLVAAVVMWLYAGSTGADQPLTLAVVILLAMVGSCIGSGIFGVLVPLALRKFGADPATASSIFLTTFTDIIGMGLMLLLATTLILG